MPWKQSKTVPEGNGPIPHHDQFVTDESTMADIHRLLEEIFDRMTSHFDRPEKRWTNLRR